MLPDRLCELGNTSCHTLAENYTNFYWGSPPGSDISAESLPAYNTGVQRLCALHKDGNLSPRLERVDLGAGGAESFYRHWIQWGVTVARFWSVDFGAGGAESFYRHWIQ